ncbi:MAG: TrpB-like pyridoxal phosphate-dependent enzyme [Candidatus Beckwithbacteria bacterium]|nr:TrpB-like pyridoxal phosphate-dependent enzyme [Candidatus Beckwithbacteria bacterium]
MKQVQHFLNINYYLKKYLGELAEPALNPGTKQPIKPEDLAAIFPMELIRQEATLDEFVEIPDEVAAIYQKYRATPLVRARGLEKYLKTPARIYYKNESVTLSGSHKINTAIPQAYYNQKEGIKRLATETGAGQWGSALAMACSLFGLKCLIFMVKVSFEQKPQRQTIMRFFGAEVFASPSMKTQAGRKFLLKNPKTTGSLGMAISEAIEVAAQDKTTNYALGSVLNHVLLHQTIIGQEARQQLKDYGEKPDVVIGCCGGGSNFSGLAFPFLADQLAGKAKGIRSMTKGEYRYDFGDTGQMTPLLKMETLGADFVPSPIHAGGLRYHGIAPILAFLHQKGLMEAKAYSQLSVFKAAQIFAQAEGIIPAPETSHAIKVVIDEALRCKRQKQEEVIIFNFSGHGLLDLKGYEDFLSGKLK